jgi:hypothetical protein
VEAGPWEHFNKVLLHAERQSCAATVDFDFGGETGEDSRTLKTEVIDPVASANRVAPPNSPTILIRMGYEMEFNIPQPVAGVALLNVSPCGNKTFANRTNCTSNPKSERTGTSTDLETPAPGFRLLSGQIAHFELRTHTGFR